MFQKIWCPTLTKTEISTLRGGRKHDFRYFIGISESDIYASIVYAKLQNQMASQSQTLEFPEGFEPFETIYGTAKLCLKTMTIPAPRLRLYPVGWPSPTLTPRIVKEHKPASVLNPGTSTAILRALKAEAEIFDIKHRIRRHAAECRAKLDLVLSLMEYLGTLSLPDPADRFEQYLCLGSPEFLRDLLGLLDMPDAVARPIDLELPRAA